jgi:hypothetical protein
MGFCDFPTHRIFSENGLWQRYEKPGASASRGVSVGRRVGTQMDRTFLCIGVYGEGERPEPTRSVDATIEDHAQDFPWPLMR